MNIDRLREAVEHIKAHPEQWDQESFDPIPSYCGAAFCLAGHVCALAERTPSVPWVDDDTVQGTCEWTEFLPSEDEQPECYGETAPGIAEQLLGISRRQALWLFAPFRKLRDFEEVLSTGICPSEGE